MTFKITRPDAHGLFLRKRLFRTLDAERRRPVIWVSGPPGCGKTALVSSWLEARRIPCLWYQVEMGDSDLGAFFHYLDLAVFKAVPGKKKPLPRFLPEAVPDASRFAGRYFEELYARVKVPSVLVFDNFERLGPRSPLVEVIREGFSRLPRGVNAIVLSRTGPPPAFSRKRASNRMGIIGWKDLRLTPEEAEGVARIYGKRKMSGEAVRYLQSRSDGWAAGLVLLLARASMDDVEPQRLSRSAPEEIFDYFGNELFYSMGPRMRRFLIKTAFLPSMTGKMGWRLTGRGNAASILSYLSQHHYFIETISDREPAFRYHALFREFLLSRARRECSSAELSRTRKAAAEILEEAGQVEHAVPLLREERAWEDLARVIKAHADALVRQGRGQTLLEWLEGLPEGTVGKAPWLMYWKGICHLPFAPGESRVLFEEAHRGFRLQEDPEGELLSWAGVVDAIVYGPWNLKILDPWFDTLEELLQGKRSFPSPEVEARVTCSVIRALALRRPPGVDIDKWADRAVALARSTENAALEFLLLLKVANHCFHGGDLQGFGHYLDSLRGLSRKQEIPPLLLLELYWLEAAHANLTGEHERCREVVARGLGLSEQTGIRLRDILLLGHGVLASLHLRDMAEAGELLGKMKSVLPRATPWEVAFYHFLASAITLAREDQAHARFHVDRCLALCAEIGNPWTEALARLQSAFVHEMKGEASEADDQLERAGRLGEESRMEFIRFLVLLVKAYTRLRRGDGETGLPPLREALRFGREKGFVDIYLWRPGLQESVAAEALERGIEEDYVKALIRKNALAPDSLAHYTEKWPWPLRIYTMGRFAVVRDGKLVTFPRKAQQKPLQLLKALISMGGRNVSKDHLTEILWADAEGDMAHQSFATTLSRLRKILGYEKAIVLSEGRLNLCNRHCWVDLWALERTLGQAEKATWGDRKGQREADCARLVEKAMDIYQGSFLDGEIFCSCLETSRERLRSKFLRCVESTGRHLEENGEWETALSCYRKALEVDELQEGLYRRTMICHRELGQTAEGLTTYRRCKKILSAVLGVDPSAETEAVRKSLLTN